MRPSRFSLRSASESDVDALFEIRCSVTENHQSREELDGIGVTADSVRGMISSGDYITTIAEREREAVGFTMAQISEGYIFACFVKPAFEGQGIGRAIMDAAEEGLARAGVTQSWLSTGPGEDLRAVGFYRYLGWIESGNLDDGQIVFRKGLGSVE